MLHAPLDPLGAPPSRWPPIRSISVVIPVKNNALGIARTIGSVRAAEARCPVPVEIIVVDDGSDDGPLSNCVLPSLTARTAQSLGARVVQAPGNGQYFGPFLLGVGTTRNAGIAAAIGDVIASLDADCVVAPDYLLRICAALAEHDFVALDQRPEDPDPGAWVYKHVADLVFRTGSRGAAEPSVAFRRSICHPSGTCFTPQGYAEILGVSQRAHYGTIDRDNPVYTDMAGWRRACGWLLLGLAGWLGWRGFARAGAVAERPWEP